MTGRYQICNDKYYVHVVPADHGNVSTTGRYQICNDKYYIHVVPADQEMLT
jgi:type 1 glutamine amidotransferase